MRKKLLVSGCSFTAENYFIDSDNEQHTCPVWGKLLADELDMDFVCLATNGAGNEYIYSTIQDYILSHDPKEIGLCIAAWSKAQRIDFQKKGLDWARAKPSIYGDVRGLIKRSLRFMHSFQILMEQHRIPYRHFQMISLFVDHIYEYEFKDHGGDYKKIRNECVNVIKNSPQYKHMRNFIGWPIFSEEGGFVVSDVQLHKNWGVEDRLANNDPMSTFNPNIRGYDQKIYFYDKFNKPVGIAPKGSINYDYVISEANPHPNKKGHEWLANYIKLHGFNSQRVEEKK